MDNITKSKYCRLDYIVCYIVSGFLLVAVTGVIVLVVTTSSSAQLNPPDDYTWGYTCINNKCRRAFITDLNKNIVMSLPVCHAKCVQYGTLFPRPSSTTVKISKILTPIHINNIFVDVSGVILDKTHTNYWSETKKRFKALISSKIPLNTYVKDIGKKLNIQINLISNILDLNLKTNENYLLEIKENVSEILVDIVAETYFGARHALETLSQLIIYDEFKNEMIIPNSVEIADGPVYKYRGLLLDTVRRYYSVESIKRTIDAMAIVKLNVFHWHITDSQSFPLGLESYPDFAKIGAYSPKKIYTHAIIKDIIQYAKIRGIRVVPEIDFPSHVGEGWQFTSFTACYAAQPWDEYCVGPPCGQLDPTNDELYEVLYNIYKETFELFEQPDIYHMGGDEVTSSCWKMKASIVNWMTEMGWGQEEYDFHKLWGYFQKKALEKLYEASYHKTKAILWTSTLTAEYADEYLGKDDYIIHIWTNDTNPQIMDLLEKGYELIMSNYDSFYLDCGFGSWVKTGNNWCTPYKPWHAFYNNNLQKIAGEYKSQILGGEGCLWSSLNDEYSLDSRLWPRLSALGERLWAEPETNYRDAEDRILLHREYLIMYGINPESIQPEWCLQNGGECPSESFE